MDIKNMSAEQRKEELARLMDATKATKSEAKTAKAQVAGCKAVVKAAKTAEEKAAASEVLKASEEAQQVATAKVAAAAARETEFREAVKAAEAAETQARKEADAAAAELARNADPFKALAENYAKAYPACKVFHITTDKQVFLDKDKNLAQFHQKGLGEGKVRTINVR